MAAEKQQIINDQRQRNAVVAEGFCSAEGIIGQGKRRFGLGLICEKLAVTQGATIALNVLVMNLEKLLELLFVLFASWLQILFCDQPGKGSRFVCLSIQLSLISTTSLCLTQARHFDSLISLSLSLEAPIKTA